MHKILIALFYTALFLNAEDIFGQASNSFDTVKQGTGRVVSEEFFSRRTEALIGKQFPVFAGKTMEKTIIQSKDIQGKIVFVNFWFSGCQPCMEEMPALNKLYDSLKGEKNFVFLSLTFDPDHLAAKVIKLFDIKYPVTLISENESHRLNNLGGYPTSLVLDNTGVIQWAALGGVEKQVASGQLVNFIHSKLTSQP